MESKATIEELEPTAWTIRKKLIEMFSYGKAHHFGGTLSCVEIMTTRMELPNQ